MIGAEGIPALIAEQDWTKAQEGVKEAARWLDEAESFMRSIAEREKNLALAECDTPKEVRGAAADLARAWEYMRAHDEDIREGLKDDLRAAEDLVEEVKQALLGEKPDYPRVLKTLRVIRVCADGILAQERGEHESAERFRQRAAGALRDARRAVSKAKEYVEDHSLIISEPTQELLKEAEESLKKAEEASNVADEVKEAEEAQSKRNAAYDKARQEFENYSSASPDRRWGTSSRSPEGGLADSGGSGGGFWDWLLTTGGGGSDSGGGGGDF